VRGTKRGNVRGKKTRRGSVNGTRNMNEEKPSSVNKRKKRGG